MKTAKLPVIFFFLVCTASAWAEEYNTIFFRANNSYREEKYNAAVQDYEQLVSAGIQSANVYYNLGNAYLRMSNKGKAILYYERAFRMCPRDADIRANLGFARRLVEGGVSSGSISWYGRTVFFLRGSLSTDDIALLASVLYFVAMILVALGMWLRIRRKVFYYSAGVFCLFLLIILPSFISGIYESEFQEKAVVVAEEAAVRFEPDDDATVHFNLYEGMVIQIMKSRGDWRQIRRGDGKMGWLKNAVFIVI